MNAPMASDTPSSSATPGDQHGQADEADGEQLVVGRVDQAADELSTPQRATAAEHEQERRRPRPN